MENLEEIIKNDEQNIKKSDISIKIHILKFLSDKKDIFVTNKKLVELRSLKTKEFDLKEWLNQPLEIFCNDIDQMTRDICDYLYKQNVEYLQSREDYYKTRNLIDASFEIVAFIQKNREQFQKFITKEKLYGTITTSNPTIILPYLYYQYITPNINFQTWEENIEIEQNLWNLFFELNSGVVCENKKTKDSDFIKTKEEIIKILMNEKENTYLFTGEYTYEKLIDEKMGDNELDVFLENPLDFISRNKDKLEDLELKIEEKDSLYYFWNKEYRLLKNKEVILNIIPLEYAINTIRIGYENHGNYHSVIFIFLLKFIENNGDFRYINMIKNLIKHKNSFITKDNTVSSELNKSKFEILNDKTVGQNNVPLLNFKIRQWNREVKFMYKPTGDKK